MSIYIYIYIYISLTIPIFQTLTYLNLNLSTTPPSPLSLSHSHPPSHPHFHSYSAAPVSLRLHLAVDANANPPCHQLMASLSLSLSHFLLPTPYCASPPHYRCQHQHPPFITNSSSFTLIDLGLSSIFFFSPFLGSFPLSKILFIFIIIIFVDWAPV